MAFDQMAGSTPVWIMRREQAALGRDSRQVDLTARVRHHQALDDAKRTRDNGSASVATRVSLSDQARARAAEEASKPQASDTGIEALPSVLSKMQSTPAAVVGVQTGQLSRDAATALLMGV